ncbi:nucleotidyltransferase family protein [Hydrogenobacter thermophilus]|uniref:nucleotidyltransferase family protein n=1 Tax=Hydrogenobacter thermophilus TaxID=940 RepID=UPI001E6198EB|nr:NTP transferase domain-containing protein [Hydrogenobacter thermophilus]
MLAAGKCERFGAPKFLFPYGGIPLLKKLFQECLLVNPEYTYIITGTYHRAVASKIDEERLIYNPDHAEGMASSLRLVSKISAQLGLDAVVIILSDQPFVNHHMFEELIRCHIEGYEVISFEKAGEPCPPSLFGKSYYKKLISLKGDIGAKKIIKEAVRKKIIKGYDHLLEDFDNIWEYLRLASKDPPEGG